MAMGDSGGIGGSDGDDGGGGDHDDGGGGDGGGGVRNIPGAVPESMRR